MRAPVFLAAFLLLASLRAAEPDPKIMSVTLPDKINWRRSASADTAILQGDPSKPGLYIELVRWHAGNMSRPHMHPSARYITVISGTWWVGSGTTYDPASTYPVKAGSYVVHYPNQPHYDGAKDEDCVIQIVGMGPESSTMVEKR
ncbi:MAG: cupin domain-containing protein [Acidobacteriota bacterium]